MRATKARRLKESSASTTRNTAIMPDAGSVNKGLLRPVGFKPGQYFARRNFFRCNVLPVHHRW